MTTQADEAPAREGDPWPRVTYDEAAQRLKISKRQLSRKIKYGDIPVIQPSVGRQAAQIEVRALDDYMERQRSIANQEASERAKAAKRKKAE